MVHELGDGAAAWMSAQLARRAAPLGIAVHALPAAALLGRQQWQLRVHTQGSSFTLVAPGLRCHAGPAAGESTDSLRLTGLVNRCRPVQLPAAVEDADYKSAEWSALLLAWMYGLPCPVLNRPAARQPYAIHKSNASWRRAAALAGLPIWPAAAPPLQAGLLVAGACCLEPEMSAATPRPGWPAALRRAAARAAAAEDCQLVAWTGAFDDRGLWRIGGATPWPDVQPFGHAAVVAVAGLLAAADAA